MVGFYFFVDFVLLVEECDVGCLWEVLLDEFWLFFE